MSQRKHIPTNMPTMNRKANLGKTLNDDTSRLDGVAKLTGSAIFSKDRYLPNAIFVGFLRCPYGAAELTDRNEGAALAVPGVLEVQIDREEGKYHGQHVGYIVAESPLALRRGKTALKLQWEMKESTVWRGELSNDKPDLSGATRKILANADHILEAVYTTPVQTHSCAESHGAVVDYQDDYAIVYVSTQGTFAARDGVDRALGLSQSQFETRCEYIGGGFGSKLGAGKETHTAARVAAKYKRPTYLFLDRDEEHLDTGNRPSSRTCVHIGFKNDGTILGGRIHTQGGVGVGGRGGGVRIHSGKYKLGEIERDHKDISFSGGAPRPFRAPGCPQGAFAEELMLDEIATIAGVDPVDLRVQLDTSADRREMFRLGAKIIGWNKRQPTGSQTGVIRRGFGLGSADWGLYPARTEAEVVINNDGSVEVRTGTQDIGTGQRTAMAIIAADEIGVPLHLVRVQIGNSNYPVGPASGGSMTVHNTAPAVRQAAADVKEQLLTKLANRAGGDPSDFHIESGNITRDRQSYKSWVDACAVIGREPLLGRGNRADGFKIYGGEGHPQGVQFVDLKVDAELGTIHINRIVAVQACGQAVCRKTAESQILGGVIQGISYALFEDKRLDRNTGAMVNPNLEMYKIAGTADIPNIEPILWTKGQTGPRSLGEPPTIPTAGAIAGAVYNALGVPVRDLPLTPNKLLNAMEGGLG